MSEKLKGTLISALIAGVIVGVANYLIVPIVDNTISSDDRTKLSLYSGGAIAALSGLAIYLTYDKLATA